MGWRCSCSACARCPAPTDKTDIEGQNDVAALFRSTAEGETGHAHGHLEFLEAVGDPATGLPIGSSRLNLAAAVAGETRGLGQGRLRAFAVGQARMNASGSRLAGHHAGRSCAVIVPSARPLK